MVRLHIQNYADKRGKLQETVKIFAAIHPGNPELEAAKEKQIPLMDRARLLGHIMEEYQYSVAVAGTHGKTTTTSMVSEILLEAEKDPTITSGCAIDVFSTSRPPAGILCAKAWKERRILSSVLK